MSEMQPGGRGEPEQPVRRVLRRHRRRTKWRRFKHWLERNVPSEKGLVVLLMAIVLPLVGWLIGRCMF